jgi:hypothetical protein
VGSSAPDDRRGREADGAGPADAAGGLLAEAVAELYGADPQDFTERRKELAAAAKTAGDAAAAKRIGALRKPTRAAWVVNRLARDDPDAPARLASLGAALRAAEQARDGPRLRELSAARGTLIDTLTSQALAGAGVPDPPAGLREDVTATLTAALADPEVAAEFAAGTLTRAAEWAGFGLALSAPDPAGFGAALSPPDPAGFGAALSPPDPAGFGVALSGPDTGTADAEGAAPWAQAAPVAAEPARPTSLEDGRRRREAQRRRRQEQEEQQAPAAEGRLRRERLAEERAAVLAAQAAEEAAQAAARRREIFADTERAVATAAAATADAVAAEDRLEDEVHRLEDRLTQARAELADARRRARRAEIAERKARQALDRLPRPEDGQ